MKHFFVVANSDKESVQSRLYYIVEYFRRKELGCGYVRGYVKKEEVPENTECVIVLGGDGTMIQAARELKEKDVAIIGINFGKLGFLAEVERDDIDYVLERLINDDFEIENRMMLEGRVERNGEIIDNDIALNDIVLNRSGILRILDFTVYVNDMKLKEYRADGMIISTPTGSTAYNMSAGGPIVKPSANLTVLTPICPHTLNTRSIILEGEDVISIEIKQSRKASEEIRNVYFDGDRSIKLENGDRIVITKSRLCTRIIKLSSKSFLEMLGRKMSNNEDSQT